MAADLKLLMQLLINEIEFHKAQLLLIRQIISPEDVELLNEFNNLQTYLDQTYARIQHLTPTE
jgi:hypothetical protein